MKIVLSALVISLSILFHKYEPLEVYTILNLVASGWLVISLAAFVFTGASWSQIVERLKKR